MNRYKLFHTYMVMARNGEANPLTCPYCDNEYTIWIPDNDQTLENPVLRCWTCLSDATPGSQTIKLIEDAVYERFPESAKE